MTIVYGDLVQLHYASWPILMLACFIITALLPLVIVAYLIIPCWVGGQGQGVFNALPQGTVKKINRGDNF